MAECATPRPIIPNLVRWKLQGRQGAGVNMGTQHDAKKVAPSKRTVQKKKRPDKAKAQRTPTQRRNARKRRAKQRAGSLQREQHQLKVSRPLDPSQAYIQKPRGAPIVKRAAAFFRQELHTDFPVHLGPTRGWRTVAKLAVRRNNANELSIGLFEPKTHKLVPGSDASPSHHPSINEAIRLTQQLARQCGVKPFDQEATGTGDLRYIALQVDRAKKQVQLTLVWCPLKKNSDAAAESISLQNERLDNLCSSLERHSVNNGGILHSLFVHYNASWKHDNAIFARDGKWERRFGQPHVEEYLNSASKIPLFFSPRVFRQANLDAFKNVVENICYYLKKKKKRSKPNTSEPVCVELYGGVGTIGLHVARLCHSLTCSDENPYNLQCFEKSKTNLESSVSRSKTSTVSYQTLSATDMVNDGALLDCDWVIVDPPRKGLDEDVLRSLCGSKGYRSPHLLVYVSCGFDAFQRDCRALLQSGWRLDKAEGYILFPGSDAIETLAFFAR